MTIDEPYTGYGANQVGAGTVRYINNEWETVTISNLPMIVTKTNVTYAASYYVVETGASADDGYVLSTTYSKNSGTETTAVGAAVNANNSTITIHNTETAGVVLPSTGGPGTTLYTASGLALILGAVWILFRRKREQN